MKNFTRRELLRGLTAGSALAMLRPLARAVPPPASQGVRSPFQTLNILFHGLAVIAFDPDEVHVYLPSASHSSAYLAGTWMQEVVLNRGGQYRLSGVMAGPRPEISSLKLKQNAIFTRRTIDPGPAYCTISLPFPDYVTPLRMLRREHKKDFFTGSPLPILEPSAIPQVLAFTYNHPDSTSRLQFRPLRWTPVIQQDVVNLHIWDAPAKTPTAQESLVGFTEMMKIVQTPALRLDPAYAKVKMPPPDEAPPVPGLGCEEEWTLVERLGEPKSCGKHPKYKAKALPFDGLFFILY